jgi:hypothetical protein
MEQKSFWHLVKVALLAWLSVIGFDFVLHASLLAPLYTQPHPFLLSPERAFALIPLGYLSFLILVILLIWLMVKLDRSSWKAGFLFGIQLGALVWGALVLSLLSISTAPPSLMIGWYIGQTLELGLAGLVAGAGLGTASLRRLAAWVVSFFLAAFITGVLIQNL